MYEFNDKWIYNSCSLNICKRYIGGFMRSQAQTDLRAKSMEQVLAHYPILFGIFN